MKTRTICVLMVSALFMSGCVKAENENKQEKEYKIEYISHVPEEDCYICGENDKSLMDYYRKSGMIGLVCLNTMNISNLDTRPYSDDGTEILENNSNTMMTSHGENECSFYISGMPDRGIFEAEIYYGTDEINFEKIQQTVCQNCLNKIMDMYVEEMEWNDGFGRFPEVCLIDFATNELYTLGEHHIGYWIRDFWVHIDHEEDESNVMVIYAPEKILEEDIQSKSNREY